MSPRQPTLGVRVPAIATLAGLVAVLVLALAAPAAHAQIGGFGAVGGTVSGPGGPLEGVTVSAVPYGGGSGGANDTTDQNGEYQIVPLSAGDYRVTFSHSGYITEHYDNVLLAGDAEPVEVVSFTTTPGIDAVLAPEATISGTVTGASAQPVEGVCVSAIPESGGVTPPPTRTNALGQYTLADLPANDYEIHFDPCDTEANVLGEWWDDEPSELTADTISVTAGEARTGVDAQLAPAGSISGTVLDSSGQPAVGAKVKVWNSFGVVETRTVTANGSYSVGQLLTGTYWVEFVPANGALDMSEFYDDVMTIGAATDVDVTTGSDTGPINAALNADTVPPVVTIDQGPSGPTNQDTPTFEFSTEPTATLLCSIDTGTADYGPCSGPGRTHTPSAPLADGPYTFRVQATDPSGNVGTDSQDFTVDTDPPTVAITGGPSGRTGFTAPTFTFSSEYEESTPVYECAVDTAAAVTPGWTACTTSSSHSSATLSDGDYVFRVRATDPAGNAVVDQRAFTVDGDGPDLAITGGPSGPTNDPTPSFDFSVTANATVECAIDPSSAPMPSFGSCTGASRHDSTHLADGDYVFRIRATDDAAHTTSDARSFSVDTVAPTLTIDSGPNGATSDSTPTFEFTSDTSGAQCAISAPGDSPNYGACSEAAAHTPSALADGSYTFHVRAADAAGNSRTETRSFSVDTVAPTLTIDSGPNGPTNDPTPSFGFSAAGGTVQCSVAAAGDPPVYGNCSEAGTHTADTLADGSYVLYVRVVDAAQNSTIATRSFSVDTVAPTLSIFSGPSGPTTDATPSFGFSAGAGAVECAISSGGDPPAFGACSETGGHTAPPLSDASYTFHVRVADAAGNSTTATRSFSVDTQISLTIDSGPSGPTRQSRPSFGFSAEAGASNECAVAADAEPTYGSCSAATAHTPSLALADGSYTFHVRSTDAAGNTASAQRAFSIDTRAPTLAITGGPAGESTDPQPTFTFSAESPASVTCSLDTGTANWGSCSAGGAHSPAAPLTDGSYTFRVRAVDEAGNTSTALRSFELDVQTSAPDVTPPSLKITGAPKAKTKDKTPTFTFESDDPQASFSCQVDTAPKADCKSPFTTKKLKPGKKHTVKIVAVDRAANASATASVTFLVKKKKRR